MHLSPATIGEMQAGVERTRRSNPAKADELEAWVDLVANTYEVIPMDAPSFREWARLMVGQSGDLSLDAMIAATARVHGLTVATRNERDFRSFDVPLVNPFQS